MNLMSYSHVQRASNVSSNSMKKHERKNPHDSLIYLKKFVGCLKAQVLSIMEQPCLLVVKDLLRNLH